ASKKKMAHSQTSFKGAGKVATDLATITKDLSWFHKGLLSAEKLKGEFINAIITAVGTACVAPIFIAYNPFSKEDKETKKYSAWRQPISAVIQFCATLAILKPFDNFMNKKASEGEFKDANLKSAPIDSYVAKKIRKEHPEYSTVQLNKAVEEYKKKVFNEAVIEAKEKYKFGTEIENDSLMGKKEFEDMLKKLKDDKSNPLKGLSSKQIDELATKKTMQSIQDRITGTANEINEIISGRKGSTVGSILENLDAELSKPNIESARKNILTDVVEQFENLGRDTNIAGLKKEFGNNLAEITHSMKVRQLVKATGENAKHVFERTKLWAGMVVALLVLPFACTALNYLYPRLMEIIMPETAKKKKAQQSPTPKAGKEVKA
ncbi:MAG: hypothetical protein MJ180_06445, partial [Candidatus Gastranaerophilales bacterium]|nr:hypothetical protein [Candidatus Gastranaerophilales bacterium]